MVIYSAEEFINKSDYVLLKDEINKLVSEVFNNSNVIDTVRNAMNENSYISYLILDNKIVACGFGNKDNNNSKYEPIYIHTFCVHIDYRGQNLCKKIVSEFINKFGKKHILYLTVRTESGDVNESAIKCYEKNKFIMLSEVYRDHYDGKNNAMIRLPTNSKNSIRSRRNRKTRNKRK